MSAKDSSPFSLKVLLGFILGICAFLSGIASMITGLPVILLVILISVVLSVIFSVWGRRELNRLGSGRRGMMFASWWGIGFGLLGVIMGTILTPIG